MSNLQEIKINQSKYDEIIEYLKQDNGYWLENDKWDTSKDIFWRGNIRCGNAEYNTIDFTNIKSKIL
ncbi:TPA: hypothetical protein KRM34_003611, partial [Clostridioides difficile]|nr:hypothetical protein [Clostridioides difficile]